MLFSVFFIYKTILAQAILVRSWRLQDGRMRRCLRSRRSREAKGWFAMSETFGGGRVPSDPVFAMGGNETVFDKSEAAFARRRTRTG